MPAASFNVQHAHDQSSSFDVGARTVVLLLINLSGTRNKLSVKLAKGNKLNAFKYDHFYKATMTTFSLNSRNLEF